MKILAVLGVIIGFWLFPVSSQEVGELLLMETLVVGGVEQVTVSGGEGLVGSGETFDLAVEDLRSSAQGVAFFGTVSNVVVEDDAILNQILESKHLRPAANVYLGTGDSSELTKFFAAHSGNITIQQLQTAAILGEDLAVPKVVASEGGFAFAS